MFLNPVLDKLKARDFNMTSLSTYDFSTLYTTLPHKLIKDNLIDLIERTGHRNEYQYCPTTRSAHQVHFDMISFRLFQSEKRISVLSCVSCLSCFCLFVAACGHLLGNS